MDTEMLLALRDKLDDVIYEQHTANLLALAEIVGKFSNGTGMEKGTREQVTNLVNEAIKRLGTGQ